MSIRVLALADRRTYPPLREILAEHSQEIDLIVTLGDLDYHDLHALDQYRHIPAIGVYGNHCAGSYMPLLGIINAHHSLVTMLGAQFVGMEGSPRYKKGPFQYSQEQAAGHIEQWPHVDVVLSHTPPYGVHDDSDDEEKPSHHGWHALRSYIDEHKPKYVLHGHTHPEQDTTHIGDTQVMWVWRHRFLTLDL